MNSAILTILALICIATSSLYGASGKAISPERKDVDQTSLPNQMLVSSLQQRISDLEEENKRLTTEKALAQKALDLAKRQLIEIAISRGDAVDHNEYFELARRTIGSRFIITPSSESEDPSAAHRGIVVDPSALAIDTFTFERTQALRFAQSGVSPSAGVDAALMVPNEREKALAAIVCPEPEISSWQISGSENHY